MPEARWEWVAFTLGIAVTAVLLALIVLHDGPKTAGARTAVAPRTTTTTPVTTTARATTTAPATTSTAAATTTTTATTTAPPPAATEPPPPVRLRVTARADTWLAVRRSGALLYQGTLAAGESRTFSGERFEIRFGAAANVQATLNGRPLPLPGGTYSVTVGKSGLGSRSA